MNELVDLGFLAAKVAAIGNEKVKMAVNGVSASDQRLPKSDQQTWRHVGD